MCRIGSGKPCFETRFTLRSSHFRLFPQTSSGEGRPRSALLVGRSDHALPLCRTEFGAICPHPMEQNSQSSGHGDDGATASFGFHQPRAPGLDLRPCHCAHQQSIRCGVGRRACFPVPGLQYPDPARIVVLTRLITPWRQSKMRGNGTGSLEALRIIDRLLEGQRRNRPDTRCPLVHVDMHERGNRHHPQAYLILGGGALDPGSSSRRCWYRTRRASSSGISACAKISTISIIGRTRASKLPCFTVLGRRGPKIFNSPRTSLAGSIVLLSSALRVLSKAERHVPRGSSFEPG
jgi:hypothetical protein